MSRLGSLLTVAALALTLAACDAADTASPDAAASADVAVSPERALDADVLGETILSDLPLGDALRAAGPAFGKRLSGAVYTLSDAAGPNEVLVFARGSDGSLTPAGAVAVSARAISVE